MNASEIQTHREFPFSLYKLFREARPHQPQLDSIEGYSGMAVWRTGAPFCANLLRGIFTVIPLTKGDFKPFWTS